MTTNIAVLSPHVDDAIWSVGEHMAGMVENRYRFTVITPFAGIPVDKEGRKKHVTLRREHDFACAYLECLILNGDFLDDVYPPPHPYELLDWMFCKLQGAWFDQLWIPLGIRHPDHLQAHDAGVYAHRMTYREHGQPALFFYEDLPYRENYPGLAQERFLNLDKKYNGLQLVERPVGYLSTKRNASTLYKSQLREPNDDLLTKIHSQERVWRVPD